MAGTKDKEGQPSLLIGLSRDNMEKLLQGKPILKTPEDTKVGLGLILVGGETEDSIMKDLREAGISLGRITDKRFVP